MDTPRTRTKPPPGSGERPSSALPGLPEVLVGLAVLILFTVAVPRLVLPHLVSDLQGVGVAASFLSGIAGAAAFAAAAAIRLRAWGPFGVRAVRPRWLLIGVAGGVVGMLAKILIVPLTTSLFGLETSTQDSYVAGSSGSLGALVLTAIGLVILTPIGEELFFRGVVTSWLMRYAPIVATLGSAVVFALAHGINFVLSAALVVGVITAELRRRSGSVWPGVVVHAVNNSVTVISYAAAPQLMG